MQRVRNRVRDEKRFKAKAIPQLSEGTHEDGGGLRLVVEPPKDKKKTLGARRWVLKVLTPTTPTITAVTSDIRVE